MEAAGESPCTQGKPVLFTALPRLLSDSHLFLQDEWEILLDEYGGLISTTVNGAMSAGHLFCPFLL